MTEYTIPLTTYLAVALTLTLAIYALLSWWKRYKRKWRIRHSYRRLDRLKTIPVFSHKIAYLRRTDPFVFEEMILSALKQQGHKIKRNPRYTGDGGIDGQAWINGRHHYIQAKRYKSHVSRQHIQSFEQLCKKKGSRGLFVHTGKTGGGTSQYSHNEIEIVSGQKLINLLEGGVSESN
ncbi:MAG: restriction endonuclease [Thiomicrospira sp.]